MRAVFRALTSRNYRLFFIGQTLSLVGTWMQSVAMSWLVYRLTGSASLLGGVLFAQQIPMLLVSPFAGTVTDRVDKRRLLLITQSLQALQALALAGLVFSGKLVLGEIFVLSVFIGIVNAFDNPGRQAFVIEMVEDRTLLANAIALNSTQFNIASLIGPMIAGITIHATGEGVCFLINAGSFMAVIFSLSMISTTHRKVARGKAQLIRDLREALGYIRHNHPILGLLILLAVVSFVRGFYQTMMPVFAKAVFHGNAVTLGHLYSGIGAGALTGAVLLASRKSVVGLGRWILSVCALFSIGLALFAVSVNQWIGTGILVFVGFGTMIHLAGTNTLIQTLVDDRIRGRVMSYYAMCFLGLMPVGSLTAGWIAQHSGPAATLLIAAAVGGVATLGFGLFLPAFQRLVTPVLVEKGILDLTI
ncbi:MAG: MFS transporter [Fimbriimonas sp.]|nr:MFS transporter [Fimbriimonas sp.]